MAATKKRASGMNSVGKKVKSAAKTVAKKAGKAMGAKKKTATKKKTVKSGSR
jgi:hypothetical protein